VWARTGLFRSAPKKVWRSTDISIFGFRFVSTL
jgi:hypothetical protein